MDIPLMTLDEVQGLAHRSAYERSAEGQAEDIGMGRVRTQAIFDTAFSVGVKAGLAWQLKNIDRVIERRQRDLDTAYDFGYLMIKDRVVPPVITEVRDSYVQDGDYAVRLSGALYNIEYQARFSSVAPSWREYLTLPKPTLDRAELATILRPRNDKEERAWREASADGWAQGVAQANLMYEYALDRMNRDMLGMLRFHEFVLHADVTMPVIAVESIEVTTDGQSLALDETLLRITALPEFKGNVAQWGAGVVSSSNGSEAPKGGVRK